MLRRLARRPAPKPSETYHALNGLADETLLLLMAKARPDSVKRQVSAYLTTYQRTKPSLTGTDLKALGLKPGPQFKKILDRLLDARLDGDVKNEAGERELVRKLARV
jgi:tRNA nucleotidyltransferase (CCA-adding enzyme)